ncbi:MAG: hypothetical protein ACD_54C00013G0001 [uncultured bacterium]|nr:MAG: hypothetical protein ACD_54C00013G0001 [uncultured bacterium]
MARGGRGFGHHRFPHRQVECEPFAPRNACVGVVFGVGPGARVQAGPCLIQINPGVGICLQRQPGEFGDVSRRGRIFHMADNRLRFGQDQHISGAVGQPRLGIDAFGLGRVIPVIGQRRAVDDLRLDHRRFAHLLERCLQHRWQGWAYQRMPDEQNISQQRQHSHTNPRQMAGSATIAGTSAASHHLPKPPAAQFRPRCMDSPPVPCAAI